MDTWFDATVERFEHFLEFKMYLLEEASAPIVEAILSAQQQLEQEQQPQQKGDQSSSQDNRVIGDGGGGVVGTRVPSVVVMSLSSGLKVAETVFLDAAHEFLETVYDGLDNGYTPSPSTVAAGGESCSRETSKKDDDDDGDKFLYGELTPKGVRQLLGLAEVRSALQGMTQLNQGSADSATITGNEESFSARPTRSFLDLGSGTGKVVFNAACLLNSSPTPNAALEHGSRSATTQIPCLGIELMSSRHNVACQAVLRCEALLLAAQQASNSSPHQYDIVSPSVLFARIVAAAQADGRPGGRGGLVRSILGSFFDPFEGEATVAVCFACALGFGDSLTRQLCDRILGFVQNGSLVCAVLLLRKVPEDHELFAAVTKERKVVHLETTWMNEAPAIVLTF